jgi:hypothetical protein
MTLLPVITTPLKILLKEGTIKLAFFGGKFSHLERPKKLEFLEFSFTCRSKKMAIEKKE